MGLLKKNGAPICAVAAFLLSPAMVELNVSCGRIVGFLNERW